MNKLTWKVKRYNCNSNKIEDYDILKYEEDFIRKLKKKSKGDLEYFKKELRSHFMYYYWSKSEWELIISKIDDKIYLIPWCGCRNPDEVTIEVPSVDDFDWKFDWQAFAEKHITSQVYKYEAKIDVWDQIEFYWDNFVDYCWYTRLRYERVKKEN